MAKMGNPREALVSIIPRSKRVNGYLVTALGLETIECMAAVGHSPGEIAEYLRVSVDWMRNALDEEHSSFDPDVKQAFIDGQSTFKGHLRRAQMALSETNAQMAIHLGKHVLGQKDEVQQHHHTHQVVGTMPDYDATSDQWRSQFAPNALQKIEADAGGAVEDAEYEDVTERDDEIR